MRRLLGLIRDSDDRGAALAFVGISMILLMGMAAFGTDLAWFYLNSARVQRTADAAALGGVVWLPGDESTAFSTAHSISVQNGYDDGDAETTVTPARVTGQLNQLRVTVSDTVPTFFLKVFGFDSQVIAAESTAEYIPPLKLGSPENQFGNSCDPEEFSGCGDNFWANIHGKWTDTAMGDAYSSFCRGSSDNPSCTANTLARSGGYLYGIESGAGFTLEFTDLAFHNESGGLPTSDYIRTGDRGCEDWGPNPGADCGPTMYVALYAPDPTPLILDSAPVCSTTVAPEPQVAETDPYAWVTPDGQACWSQSGPGTWVVQVRHVDPGATQDRSGLNRYSIRSTTGQLFALGDFSIYNNAAGSETAFHLADVPPYYAGKTFVIELFDPGESADNGDLEVVGPTGAIWDTTGCRIYVRDNPTQPWSLHATVAPGNDCYEDVSPQEFHNRWLMFEMDLPSDYSCDYAGGACWWKMNYDYPSAVNDTTTWKAYIIGNPIHLVP